MATTETDNTEGHHNKICITKVQGIIEDKEAALEEAKETSNTKDNTEGDQEKTGIEKNMI